MVARRPSSKAAEDDGTAVDLGSPGNVGIIGWYVPGWLAEEHPDILDYKNLNKYADDFKTSESGDQGQFLGSDPTYTQYDEAIVKNLDLDFKVVFSGGETATVEAFKKAQENKEWLIGYFWEPQYIHAEVPLERVKLPPYEPGCDADKAEVACDYAETELKKVASHGVHGLRLAGGRPGRELHVDQRGPEPGGEVHHRRQDVARGRGRQVGRGQPGQGRGLDPAT